MQKTVQLQHHFDDYECMWNGVEDLYIEKTGEQLPPSFFFSMASFGSFCYLKTDKAKIKRMVVLGDGRTRQMYQFLAPIVGFDYHFCEFKSFAQAIKKAKKEVNDEHPVVLGALDMYYLSYFPTMYHAEHIPFHYFMMTGYDDKAEVITLLDCGRQEPQQVSYGNLEKAWNCSYDGLSKPFTLCTVRMNSDKNKDRIAKEVLREKAERFLNLVKVWRGDPAVGDGAHHGLGAAGNIQLVVNARQVGLDGAVADLELHGNRLVGVAFARQVEHFQFARTERVGRGRPPGDVCLFGDLR